MSSRALIKALVAVSLALAVTIGVLVGMNLNRGTSTASASLAPTSGPGPSNAGTSPIGSTTSAPPTQLTRGRVAQSRPATLKAEPMKQVAEWAEEFREFWDQRYDRLEDYLRTMHDDPKDHA